MQVHSIISNTISEEVIESGHLSIRFRTDGFSLLLEDSNFKPVILNDFFSTPYPSTAMQLKTCEEWLDNHTLLENFRGETTVIVDSGASVFIPEKLFSASHSRFMLEQTSEVPISDEVLHRKIRNRPFHVAFTVSKSIAEFAGKFHGENRILHQSECLLSAADQVDASDHQRGFMIIENQPASMEILAVRKDQLLFSGRQKISSGDMVAYHVLNTMKQLELDREKTPFFLAGIYSENDEPVKILGKYLKKVLPMPYFIRDLDKDTIGRHIILSEATKCE